MWAFFVFSIIGVVAAIVMLLRRYCAKDVTWAVRLSTAYAWFVAFAVVAVVPLDVYSTLRHESPAALGIMWQVAFWSTQFLTWLLLPFFQYYAEAGDFTVKGKCLTSLKENAILYGSVGAVGLLGVFVLLITKQMTFEDLVGFGIGLTNVFGLIVSIILLGYGLVEIPRHLWKSVPERQLKWCAHRVGKFAEKVMRSTAELETVVTIIHANERQIRRHEAMRKYMDIILEHVERESPIRPSDLQQRAAVGGSGIDIESLSAEDLEYNGDVQGLAALRTRMFFAIAEYKGDRAMYEQVMLKAFELEDIVKCRQRHEYVPYVPEGQPPPNALRRAAWYYKCVLREHWHKVFSVVLGVTSLLVVWAEATIWVEELKGVDISPLSHMIKGTAGNQFAAQLLTLLPLAYICACCYSALFSINAFNYNKLIPKATIGSSLMQNGSLCCRFVTPICWNFYYMIHMTKPVSVKDPSGTTSAAYSTVFTENMGNMKVPDFLSTHLNTYLPIILVVECCITALDLWDKILNCCVSHKRKFSNTDDVDDEYTEKGRALIAREREAVGKGQPIGEVLTSAFFDLDFPDIIAGPRSRVHQQRKGLFTRLFGNKRNQQAQLNAPTPQGAPSASAAAPASGRPKSATAAAAAARWLGRGDGLPAPSAASTSGPALESTRTSLLGARYDQGADAAAAGGARGAAPGGAAAGGSGLDGIFADLGAGRGGAAGRAAGGAAAGAGAGAGAGALARVGDANGHSEKDSLLGGFWGRS